MIVSANNYQPNVDIQVTLYKSYSTEPFLVRLTDGVTIHMSLQEAERLHLQLTGALYEYDRDYKYKVSK